MNEMKRLCLMNEMKRLCNVTITIRINIHKIYNMACKSHVKRVVNSDRGVRPSVVSAIPFEQLMMELYKTFIDL